MTSNKIRFILISILFVLLCRLVSGQDSIILNQSISGVKLYEATKSITLKTNFEFSANSSSELLAKIIPTASGSKYLYTENLESFPLEVDTTYPVGTINGSASVDPIGGANYSIPIDLPPGRAGIKPQLALVYNSKAGDGLMGLGWSLAGFSSISRVPTNLYHEYFIDGVDFDSNDKFALDGQRLIHDPTISAYRTEIESFSKITLNGSSSNPTSFKVETKEGLELNYGYTNDSKLENEGGNFYIWNLNKVKDKYGNFYTITYSKTISTGDIYPTSINYTGNGANAGIYTIELSYSNRTVAFKTYIVGTPVTLSKRLNIVTIKNDTAVIGKYEIKYKNSKISEVIKFGKSNSRYNSTIFNWGIADSGCVATVKNTLANEFKRFMGDYNGDGRTDIVIVRNTGLGELYLADNSGTMSVQDSFSMPVGFNRDKIYVGDYNGDGLDDLLTFKILNGITYYYNFFISNGNSFSAVNCGIPFNYQSDFFHTADFNGNGKAEILIKIPGGTPWNCLIHEFNFPSGAGVDTLIIGKSNIIWGDTIVKEKVLDLNGNGKMDLMVLDSLGNKIYELLDNTGSMAQISSSSYPANTIENIFGDFNGDGMMDIYSFGPGSSQKLSISRGNGFDTQPNYTFDGYVEGNKYYSQDMNGDGKSDVIAIGHGRDLNLPFYIYVAYSNGQDFTTRRYDSLGISLTMNNDYFNFGDFNGDGVIDIYYEDSNFARLINIFRSRAQYFVSDIVNGLGYHTKFNYSSLANNSFYTKGFTSLYPVVSNQGSVYNVSSLSFQTGVKGTHFPIIIWSTTNYQYTGAHTHLKGKGFLGFEKVTSTNTITKIQSVEEYSYNPTYFNPILKKTSIFSISDSTGSIPISELKYTNGVTLINGKGIFTYIDSTKQINYLTGVTVTKNFDFDPNGNLTYEKELYDDASYNSKTYSSFSSAGSWIPSKPTTILTTRKHFQDGQTYSLTTKYAYNSLSGKVDTLTIGPLKTNYKYNSTYGNLYSVRVSDGTTSRRDSFVYDSKNMFVEKSYNALNHVTLRTYNYDFGNIKDETAPNTNLKKEYRYDNFGALDSIFVTSLGQIQTIKYGWTTGLRTSGAIFYKQIVTSGEPTIKEYYDAFGRLLKTQKQGFDGNLIFAENDYNSLNQLTQASQPWKSGETALGKVFSYDKYGRIIKETSDAGTLSYSYSGKTIGITASGGQNSSKTMDSQGNVLTSTDNGGTITNTYKSIGKPSTITNNGATWNMVYDAYGRQTSLNDPNVGTITYRYNKFGEITRQLDAKGNIDSLTYDKLGRVLTEVRFKASLLEGTKLFFYDPSGKPGLLDSVSYTGGYEKYNYDTKGRLTNNVIKIDGNNFFTTRYGYDNLSRIQTLTYPSNFAVKYVYNNFGYLDEVRRNDTNVLIWDATSMNVFGQYTQYNSGNAITTTKTYDCLGMLRGIAADTIQNLGYSFDEETGNLISRRDNRRNLTEIFNYDNLNRLTTVSGPAPLSTSYANNGNITNKTSVGDYSYGELSHAVTSVTNPNGLISTTDQRVSYTSFNKADSIIQGNYIYTLQYGCNDQRTVSKLFRNDTLQKTVYYIGAYEKEVIPGIPYPKNIHYIYGGDGLAAIYTTQSSNSDMYYVHKDHLGSIDKITNSSKAVIQKTSFDAWGRRRNPDNWTYANIPATIFSRGYTGHEHLDLFDLINMNGRMYDPLLGRFLSPDNVVQNPYGSQSYNRYSYCFNNPLKYIDPSGWQLAPIDQYWNLGTAPGNFGNFFGSPLQDRNACPYILGSDGIYYNKNGFIVSPQEVLMNYILPNCMGGLTLEITSTTKTTVITISEKGDVIDNNTAFRVNPNGHYVYTWTLTSRHTVVATSVSVAASGGGDEHYSNYLEPIKIISEIGRLSSEAAREGGYIATIGSNLNYYSKWTTGNQYVKVFGIAKGATYGFFGVGAVIDVTMYSLGEQSLTKTLLNVGVNTTALIIGGVPGILLGAGYLYFDKVFIPDINKNPGFWSQAADTWATYPFNCFVEGSQVLMGDGIYKKIEFVQIGDTVLTYNLIKKQFERNPVLKINSPIHDRFVKITFSNEAEVISTEDHPYYVKGKGWSSFNPDLTFLNYGIKAGRIEISDFCFIIKGRKLKKVKVTQMLQLDRSVRTYNLTKITNSDNYFVNGILVGNESKIEL